MHSWGQCNATLNLPLPVPAFTLAFKSLTVDWHGTASPGASQGQCVDTIAIQCGLQASRRNMLLSNILMIATNLDQTSIWRKKNTFFPERINIEKRLWTKGKDIRESVYQSMPMSLLICHSNCHTKNKQCTTQLLRWQLRSYRFQESPTTQKISQVHERIPRKGKHSKFGKFLILIGCSFLSEFWTSCSRMSLASHHYSQSHPDWFDCIL